jgi:hypothetical protein
MLLYCCCTAAVLPRSLLAAVTGRFEPCDISSNLHMYVPTTSPLLPPACPPATWLHAAVLLPYCCCTAAVLLLYCCFTAALLLLYCCHTAAVLLPYCCCCTAQILAGSSEKLSEAKREVQVLQALSHVNCLPLLAHSISQSAAAGGAYEVLLVFPAYQVCMLVCWCSDLCVAPVRVAAVAAGCQQNDSVTVLLDCGAVPGKPGATCWVRAAPCSRPGRHFGKNSCRTCELRP